MENEIMRKVNKKVTSTKPKKAEAGKKMKLRKQGKPQRKTKERFKFRPKGKIIPTKQILGKANYMNKIVNSDDFSIPEKSVQKTMDFYTDIVGHVVAGFATDQKPTPMSIKSIYDKHNMKHLLPRISVKDEEGKMNDHTWEDMERAWHAKEGERHFHRVQGIDDVLSQRGFNLDDRKSVADSMHELHMRELDATPSLGGLNMREEITSAHSDLMGQLGGGELDEKHEEVTAHPYPAPEFKLTKSGLKRQLADQAQRAEDLINKARQKEFNEEELNGIWNELLEIERVMEKEAPDTAGRISIGRKNLSPLRSEVKPRQIDFGGGSEIASDTSTKDYEAPSPKTGGRQNPIDLSSPKQRLKLNPSLRTPPRKGGSPRPGREVSPYVSPDSEMRTPERSIPTKMHEASTASVERQVVRRRGGRRERQGRLPEGESKARRDYHGKLEASGFIKSYVTGLRRGNVTHKLLLQKTPEQVVKIIKDKVGGSNPPLEKIRTYLNRYKSEFGGKQSPRPMTPQRKRTPVRKKGKSTVLREAQASKLRSPRLRLRKEFSGTSGGL